MPYPSGPPLRKSDSEIFSSDLRDEGNSPPSDLSNNVESNKEPTSGGVVAAVFAAGLTLGVIVTSFGFLLNDSPSENSTPREPTFIPEPEHNAKDFDATRSEIVEWASLHYDALTVLITAGMDAENLFQEEALSSGIVTEHLLATVCGNVISATTGAMTALPTPDDAVTEEISEALRVFRGTEVLCMKLKAGGVNESLAGDLRAQYVRANGHLDKAAVVLEKYTG